MIKNTKSATVDLMRYRTQTNGALAIHWSDVATGRSHILQIGPGPRVNLLAAAGESWEEVELRSGRSPRNGRLLVTNRRATKKADDIAVTNAARNDRGDKLESSGVLSGSNSYLWHRVYERKNGFRLETEARRDRLSRTAFDSVGHLRWTSEASYAANAAGGVPVRGSTEIIRDSNGREIGKTTTWESASGKGFYSQSNDGSSRYELHREYYPDGRMKSETEQWTDGSSKSSTHKQWDTQGGLDHSHTVKTESGPGGKKTDTIDEWKGKEKNPVTGEDNDVYYREEKHTDSSGKTSTDRWASTGDASGNQSSTHVHTGADGSVTIETVTVDANGKGTSHITVIDSKGKIIDYDPVPIGTVGGGPSPSSPSPSPTDDSEPEEPNDQGSSDGEEPDDGNDGDNDGDDGDDDGGDDTDDGGDDDDGGEDVDDGGGDDGDMDWDGTDDGRPKLPKFTGALSFEFELPPGATDADVQAWAEAFIAAVKNLIASGREPGEGPPELTLPNRSPVGAIGGVSPGGATGEGDWGMEGLPEIRPEAGDWITLRGGQGPTEDWGGWTDPRVLIAYGFKLSTAVAADTNSDGRGVIRAFHSLRALDAAVKRVGFGS